MKCWRPNSRTVSSSKFAMMSWSFPNVVILHEPSVTSACFVEKGLILLSWMWWHVTFMLEYFQRSTQTQRGILRVAFDLTYIKSTRFYEELTMLFKFLIQLWLVLAEYIMLIKRKIVVFHLLKIAAFCSSNGKKFIHDFVGCFEQFVYSAFPARFWGALLCKVYYYELIFQ